MSPIRDAGGEVDRDGGDSPPVAEQVARVCSSDAWCWDGSGPHGNTLFAVAANSEVDIWAVGERGLALHFDGGSWQSRWAPTDKPLRAVSLVEGDAWVVGDDATVLRYSPLGWEAIAIPGLQDDIQLRGVWRDGRGDVWIVGTQGTLLERRAGVWSKALLSTTASLNGVWAARGVAWAVGDGGTVLRGENGEWVPVDAGTTQNLNAVHGHGGDVWLAGSGAEVRFYDGEGERWQRPSAEGPAPEGQLRGVQVTAEQRAYIANERGDVYEWDGAATCPVPGDAGAPREPCPKWGPARSTGRDLPVFGLWASGEQVVAVGAHGSMISWQAQTRTVISEGSLDNYLDVAGSDADNVWIAGDRLLSLDGERWTHVTRDSPRAVYAVQPLDAERTLVAGTGGMARSFSGESWVSMDVRADVWLQGMWSDGNVAWLVGSRGTAWGLLNHRLWTQLSTPTERDLLAVWSTATGTAWAVGAGGVILRHDGALWAAIPSGPNGGVTADLRGVWGTAEDDIWAVGTGGTALHWNGSVWTNTTADSSFSLNDVWCRSRNDVWAVGSGGTILHYDGEEWLPELSGTGDALNAVWGNGDRLWVVGEHGVILIKDLR